MQAGNIGMLFRYSCQCSRDYIWFNRTAGSLRHCTAPDTVCPNLPSTTANLHLAISSRLSFLCFVKCLLSPSQKSNVGQFLWKSGFGWEDVFVFSIQRLEPHFFFKWTFLLCLPESTVNIDTFIFTGCVPLFLFFFLKKLSYCCQNIFLTENKIASMKKRRLRNWVYCALMLCGKLMAFVPAMYEWTCVNG